MARNAAQRFEAVNIGLPLDSHPHRGFETISFVRIGGFQHTNFAGFSCTIAESDKTIVHPERAPDDFRRVWGQIEVESWGGARLLIGNVDLISEPVAA